VNRAGRLNFKQGADMGNLPRHVPLAQDESSPELKTTISRSRIEEAVLALVDHERWDRQIAVQKIELDCISEVAERMKNLPQINQEAQP
jgi:hypothetical protein